MCAELFEDDCAADGAEAGSAGTRRQQHRKETESGERAPVVAIDALASTREVVVREPVGTQPADGVPQLELRFVEAEVHGGRRSGWKISKYSSRIKFESPCHLGG